MVTRAALLGAGIIGDSHLEAMSKMDAIQAVAGPKDSLIAQVNTVVLS